MAEVTSLASEASSRDFVRNRQSSPSSSVVTASSIQIETGREATWAVAIPTRKASEIQKRGRIQVDFTTERHRTGLLSETRLSCTVYNQARMSEKLILVTGATGYVGGRLVPRLLEAGYRVRCLVRDPSRLEGFAWAKRVEIVTCDMSDPVRTAELMSGVSVAYYLIHGQQGGHVNAEHDLQVARNFACAAEQAEIERIIYLGELVDPTAKLSPYLRSRHETGYQLRYHPHPRDRVPRRHDHRFRECAV